MNALIKYVLPGAAVVAAAVAIYLQSLEEAFYALVAWLVAGVFLCGYAIARSTRLGAFLTAVGCFAANGYLLSRKLAADAGPSICTLSSRIDCDLVNTSEFSEVAGIPVTLLGVGFYAGLALASLTGPDKAPRFHQVNALFAILALLYSAYLAVASVSLGAVCVVCISIYVGNALLLVAGLKGLRETGTSLFEDVGRAFTSRSFVTVAGVFVVVVLLGRSSLEPPAPPTTAGAPQARPMSPANVADSFARLDGELHLHGDEPVLGDPNAPYTVVEFADYGCPHCAQAAGDLEALVRERPDVQVRFKFYPLSGACNPMIPSGDGGAVGAERCLAAVAAYCAHQQGRFWEYSHNLFRNMGSRSLDDLRFMATQEGLDAARWEACVMDPAAAEAVVRDVRAGIDAGVRGTPTLYLHGTHGDRWVLVTWTVRDLLELVEAHRQGVQLPEPGPVPLN